MDIIFKKTGFFLFLNLVLFQIVFAQESEFKVGRLSEGIRVYIDQNQRMGFMDENYNKINAPTFDFPGFFVSDELPFFSEGLCVFFIKEASEDEVSYKYGFINKNFKVVIPPQYPHQDIYCDNYPPYFTAGRAIVNSPDQNANPVSSFVLIDKTGKRVGNQFSYSLGFLAACAHFPEITENLIVYDKEVDNNTVFGYLDAITGSSKIATNFTNAGPFSEGLAVVEIGGKYLTLIDKTGKPVISQKFYIVKKGSNSPSLYSAEFGDSKLNGFIDGNLFIQYFDQDGMGEHVYALIDKSGKIISKKSKKSVDNQIDFQKYHWMNRKQ